MYDKPCTERLKNIEIDENFKPIKKIVYEMINSVTGETVPTERCDKKCMCKHCVANIRMYCPCNGCDLFRSLKSGNYTAYFECKDTPKIAEVKHKKAVQKIKLMKEKKAELIEKIKAIQKITKEYEKN